ncbi:MAG: hypothetical protein EOP50_20715 [Sphingobacteriales bacterium]|nr:MAG: hypothetical protein EOP50_20715 [Sphingobacteriales bacterium]
MNAFFRGVLGGIMELKEKLEQKSLGAAGNAWKQTVVHFSGDFGRVGNTDGNGSEHGWAHNVSSVITGAFTNGPFCVGNIYAGSGAGGTNGWGAPIANYPTPGVPGLPFVASQVAHLLGLQKNPFENVAPPAVKLVGSTLVANYPGKLIVGG